jgi:hypothetical protein
MPESDIQFEQNLLKSRADELAAFIRPEDTGSLTPCESCPEDFGGCLCLLIRHRRPMHNGPRSIVYKRHHIQTISRPCSFVRFRFQLVQIAGPKIIHELGRKSTGVLFSCCRTQGTTGEQDCVHLTVTLFSFDF